MTDPAYRRLDMLERDEEKWNPVFLDNHATTQKREQDDVSFKHHPALVTASQYAVLRAAVRALHPDTRAVRGFRKAREHFHPQMHCAHAARQAAGDQPTA